MRVSDTVGQVQPRHLAALPALVVAGTINRHYQAYVEAARAALAEVGAGHSWRMKAARVGCARSVVQRTPRPRLTLRTFNELQVIMEADASSLGYCTKLCDTMTRPRKSDRRRASLTMLRPRVVWER